MKYKISKTDNSKITIHNGLVRQGTTIPPWHQAPGSGNHDPRACWLTSATRFSICYIAKADYG